MEKMSEVEVAVFEDSLPALKKAQIKLRLALIFFLLVLLSDHNVRMLFTESDPRLIACMCGLFIYALATLFTQSRELYLDTSVVEDMECDRAGLSIQKKAMPLDIKQANSFFVKKYAWLISVCSGRPISAFRKEALESEYLCKNKEISLIGGVLTLLGLAGTMMGLANALAGVSQGIDVTEGVSYAFGSTLMGIFGYIVISTMNLMIQEKKSQLLSSFLDIVSAETEKQIEVSNVK